jgi:N-acylneuraminate cytidylyltransferase
LIEGLKVLAVIPARGGSKGLKHKNIRMVAGVPLLGWSVKVARQSRFVDDIVVSTEDSSIAGVARGIGCSVVERPEEYATDDAKIEQVALHALSVFDFAYDYVVILQPTCPMRRVSEIDGCLATCINKDAASCSTISPHDEHPMKSLIEMPGFGITPYFGEEYLNAPRQSLPKFYKQTGSVYVNRVADFMEAGGVAFVQPWVPYVVSWRGVDIDDEFDLAVADMALRKGLS